MAGVQYVGGMLFPLTQSGEVPMPRQKADEIGTTVVPQAAPVQAAMPGVASPISAAVAQTHAPITPKQVISLARKRRAEVKRELARMKKLEAELAQLERLLAAADGKPLAVVRDIHKRTAG